MLLVVIGVLYCAQDTCGQQNARTTSKKDRIVFAEEITSKCVKLIEVSEACTLLSYVKTRAYSLGKHPCFVFLASR